jgi:pimeloyl-ACP methyl ester carboxylesterase
MTHRRGCNLQTLLRAALVCAVATQAGAGKLSATELLMKDGRLLTGELGYTSSLGNPDRTPGAAGKKDTSIPFLDDNMRWTFVAKQQILEARPDSQPQVPERFRVHQPAKSSGPTVAMVGPIIRITPFDEFGRRTYTMSTPHGPVDIVQGITEITPEWTKVEGITYKWDMRIATSSIPPDVLHKVLMRQIKNPKDVSEHKRVAHFYVQADLYEEARQELQSVLLMYPDDTEVKAQLEPMIKDLRQHAAEGWLRELKRRSDAGQHRLVVLLLKQFPTDDVSGESLQVVREMIQEYEALQARGKKVIQQIDALLAKIKDSDTRRAIRPLRQEIAQDLTYDTLDRMAAFLQNVDDPKMPAEDKLALAISGWLLGPADATTKLGTALSLARLRDLLRRYLKEPAKLNRARLFHDLPSEEGATPTMLAEMIAHMKPAYELPPPVSEDMPGYYDLEVSIFPGEAPVHYLIQLPPDYDPYRRYPMIITLHGAGTTPRYQIDWWAGDWGGHGRGGQAGRRGYIVMAPQWAGEHQEKYRYTLREHKMVLGCYRDACRRFAVDTDRVFLSGHSMGGDAAWDMGLAHPDLWAGVIPVVAEADRFCAFYRKNAKNLPFYVVGGELDGNKMSKNATELDHYLRAGYNATIVQYRGRGHENFSDEIQRLFDWMGRFHRDFFPRDIDCATMREGDNFFWWVELGGMPPRTTVNPEDWPPPHGSRPAQVSARITANNNLSIQTKTTSLTVWLAPGMFDFKRPISIVVNGRKMNNHSSNLAPNLETLLEDVRSRGDRLHPFWSKFECTTGRLAE